MENRLISRNVWISTRNTGVKLTELKFTSKKSVSGIDGNSVCFPFLPPATKLRQGNVVIMFTGGLCQGDPRTETPLDRDPLRQRPLWTETHQTETPPDRDPMDRVSVSTVKSGRYASYWNAFLFSFQLCFNTLNCRKQWNSKAGMDYFNLIVYPIAHG